VGHEDAKSAQSYVCRFMIRPATLLEEVIQAAELFNGGVCLA
jgi:hypothetical protein